MFVWARAFCGTRISCPASVDFNGTAGKIFARKIRQAQGDAHACYHDGFHELGTFNEAPETVQSPIHGKILASDALIFNLDIYFCAREDNLWHL